MGDESDQARADAKRQLLQDLDDDFTAALGDPVHDIVERVRNGTLTRAEAEDWAREQGRPPFTGRPDPATFEPREKRYWTLAQMAAWALWRTDDAVRGVSEEYVSRCVEWVEAKRPQRRFVTPVEWEFASSTDRVGYELGSPKVATAHDVIESARHRALLGGGSPMLSPERAQREILDALQAGAHLVARHGVMAEIIDRHVWSGLSPFDGGRGPHDAVFDHGRVARFHRVRVERDAVLAVWPRISSDDAEAPSKVLIDAPTSALRFEEARGFIARESPPPGLSSDALVAWVAERANAIGRKIHRDDVRAYHKSEAYVGTRQRGRPRKSAK